ncbi:MAG: M67 family metallopeptidase [Bacillaceae bacterium]|nr:M67 family metallopeptidase [Bacillaceae bacterium]
MIEPGQPFDCPQPITITKRAVETLLGFAREVYPEEASGVLGGNGSQITHAFLIPNGASDKLTRFSWKPEDFLKGLQQIKEHDLEWLGVFHSHPTSSSRPSRTDIDNWHYHSLSYWIVSLENKEEPILSLYRFLHGSFVEQDYRVVE